MRGRQRGRERGQAIVELAVALPMLLAAALLVLAGGRLLGTAVGLANAARAGATAAAGAVARGDASQEIAAATQAAASEGQVLTCQGSGVPASCVAVSNQTGTSSGEDMEVVTVYDQVDTGFPGLPVIQIQERAAATP